MKRRGLLGYGFSPPSGEIPTQSGEGVRGIITADSQPDYDGWGPDSYWGCAEWQAWHQVLEQEYGRARAKEMWLTAWEKQGSFDHALNACRYNSDFVSYFMSKGIDIRSFVSAIFTNVTEAAVNTTQAAVNTTESAASIGKSLKWVLPVLGTAALVAGGVFVYKKFDTLKKLVV